MNVQFPKGVVLAILHMYKPERCHLLYGGATGQCSRGLCSL